MLLYGMKSRSRIGKATSALGLGLMTRGITNREMAEIKGMKTLRRLVQYDKPTGCDCPSIVDQPVSYDRRLLSTASATAASLKLYPKPRTERISAGLVGSVSVFWRSRRM